MFRVVTLSKENMEPIGYLGVFDTLTEAREVSDDYNRKVDRHPAIASIEQVEDQNFGENIRKNPSPAQSEFVSDFEDYSEDSDFSEEIYSEDSETISEESLDDAPVRFNFRSRRNVEEESEENFASRKPVQSMLRSARQNHSQFMFSPKIKSYQGIMIDRDGYVVIREPANHSGAKYEFYGGRAEEGEDPTDAVLRETAEETGYAARIVAHIGRVDHGDRELEFFLLKPLRQSSNWQGFDTSDEETWSVVSVSRSDAEYLLGQNSDKEYSQKLVDMLDKAYERWNVQGRSK